MRPGGKLASMTGSDTMSAFGQSWEEDPTQGFVETVNAGPTEAKLEVVTSGAARGGSAYELFSPYQARACCLGEMFPRGLVSAGRLSLSIQQPDDCSPTGLIPTPAPIPIPPRTFSVAGGRGDEER